MQTHDWSEPCLIELLSKKLLWDELSFFPSSSLSLFLIISPLSFSIYQNISLLQPTLSLSVCLPPSYIQLTQSSLFVWASHSHYSHTKSVSWSSLLQVTWNLHTQVFTCVCVCVCDLSKKVYDTVLKPPWPLRGSVPAVRARTDIRALGSYRAGSSSRRWWVRVCVHKYFICLCMCVAEMWWWIR